MYRTYSKKTNGHCTIKGCEWNVEVMQIRHSARYRILQEKSHPPPPPPNRDKIEHVRS